MEKALNLESRDPAWPYTNWVTLASPTPHKRLILLRKKMECHQIHRQGPFSCEDCMNRGNKPLEKPPQEMSSNPCIEPPQTVTHNFATNKSKKLGHSKSVGKQKNRTRKLPGTASPTESRQGRLTIPLILSCRFSGLRVFIFALGERSILSFKKVTERE